MRVYNLVIVFRARYCIFRVTAGDGTLQKNSLDPQGCLYTHPYCFLLLGTLGFTTTHTCCCLLLVPLSLPCCHGSFRPPITLLSCLPRSPAGSCLLCCTLEAALAVACFACFAGPAHVITKASAHAVLKHVLSTYTDDVRYVGYIVQ